MSLCYPTDRPACTLPSHQLPALPIIIPSALLSCVYYRSSYSHSSPAHTVHHHTLFISPLHVAHSHINHTSPLRILATVIPSALLTCTYCPFLPHTAPSIIFSNLLYTYHSCIILTCVYCPLHYPHSYFARTAPSDTLSSSLMHILPPPVFSILYCIYCYVSYLPHTTLVHNLHISCKC